MIWSFCARGHILKEPLFTEENKNIVFNQYESKHIPNPMLKEKDVKRDFDNSLIEGSVGKGRPLPNSSVVVVVTPLKKP